MFTQSSDVDIGSSKRPRSEVRQLFYVVALEDVGRASSASI